MGFQAAKGISSGGILIPFRPLNKKWYEYYSQRTTHGSSQEGNGVSAEDQTHTYRLLEEKRYEFKG